VKHHIMKSWINPIKLHTYNITASRCLLVNAHKIENSKDAATYGRVVEAPLYTYRSPVYV
jgi:hypothetical protein